MKRKQVCVHLLILLALFLLTWWFSGQDGTRSQSLSDGLLILDPDSPLYPAASFVIRKGAHFFLYFLYGLDLFALSGVLGLRLLPQKLTFALVLLACFAGIDEIHQCFIPGRAGRIDDVLLDVCGGLCGCLVFWLFKRHRKGI